MVKKSDYAACVSRRKPGSAGGRGDSTCQAKARMSHLNIIVAKYGPCQSAGCLDAGSSFRTPWFSPGWLPCGDSWWTNWRRSGFYPRFSGCSTLIYHRPTEVCDTPNHAAHYHILRLSVWGFVSELTLGWSQSKEIKFFSGPALQTSCEFRSCIRTLPSVFKCDHKYQSVTIYSFLVYLSTFSIA